MAEAPNFAVALQEIRQQNNLNRIQQEESDKRQKADDDERIRALGEKIEKASAKETKTKLEADLKLFRAQIAARKEAPTKSEGVTACLALTRSLAHCLTRWCLLLLLLFLLFLLLLLLLLLHLLLDPSRSGGVGALP